MICIPKYNELMKSSVTKESQQRHGAQFSACFATAFPYAHMNSYLGSQWAVHDLLPQSFMRMGMSRPGWDRGQVTWVAVPAGQCRSKE